MKTFGSAEKVKNNGENVSHLDFTEVVLVHCNIVYNDYQYNSRVLCTCRNKSLGELLHNSRKNFIFFHSSWEIDDKGTLL